MSLRTNGARAAATSAAANGALWRARSASTLSHQSNRNACEMILNHGVIVSGSVANAQSRMRCKKQKEGDEEMMKANAQQAWS